jgi:hypothetical protein
MVLHRALSKSVGAMVASNVSLAHRPTDSRGTSCVAETVLGHFAETEFDQVREVGSEVANGRDHRLTVGLEGLLG